MTDLGEFLLARITEDEVAAITARERNLPFWVAQEMGRSGGSLGQDYVNRFSPDRVMTECEAKRAIVALHHSAGSYLVGDEGGPRQGYCATCGSGEPYEYPAPWPCWTLKLLGAPYVDHRDYRQEWKP